MLATRRRAVRSCSLGRSKNKAVLEPLPGEPSMIAGGGASSTIAAARRELAESAAFGGRDDKPLKHAASVLGRGDLPPLPMNLPSASTGNLRPSKLPLCAERTAVASKIYGADPGQQLRQAPGAIKKLEPRIPPVGRPLHSEAGGGIRRRKMSATACLKPLDHVGDRSSNASPAPLFTPTAGGAEGQAPWERDLFSAATRTRVDAAESSETSTSVESQHSVDSQCLAASPVSAPSTPAPAKPSTRRPPSGRSRPSPRLAAASATPRPVDRAAAPKTRTLEHVAPEKEDSDKQVSEKDKHPSVDEPLGTSLARTAAETPAEEAARARACLVFREMFAHELRVNGGDANSAAASALHRLAARQQR